MPESDDGSSGEEKASIRLGGEVSIDSGEPVVRDEMDIDKLHPSFPEKHGYLKDSLKDLDEVNKQLDSLKEEGSEEVLIREEDEEPPDSVSEEELDSYDEFKRRRIRNRAIKKVKELLREKDMSEESIRNNRDAIESKVDDYLFG
ncbi:MAG: hypothetical protein MUP58_03390 [Candidatus Nanohaloarchaeota archaeon QJJ-9]|nr:hypothetical protein [Candidatus Nanohaloarchaeota archaeon QJJ-9]